MRLAGIEPVHVEEKAPAHRARPRPHEPRRREDDGNPGELIEHQHDDVDIIGGRLFRQQSDLPRRTFAVQPEIDSDRAPRQDIVLAAEHRQRIAASRVEGGLAAHALKIDPIADLDAGTDCRRDRFVLEGTVDVVNHSVVIGVEAQRPERLHHPGKVRHDHGEPPGGKQDQERSAGGHEEKPLRAGCMWISARFAIAKFA